MWEPGEDPGEKEWSALQRRLVEHPAQWMLWEGEPASASVTRLESIGVRSLVFAPAGNRPAQGDYLDVMLRNLDALERAMQ